MKEFDRQLAYKYLSGQCTPEEARGALSWFATEEGKLFLEKSIHEDSYLLDEKLLLLPSGLDSEGILRQIMLLKDKQPLPQETNGARAEDLESQSEVSVAPSGRPRRTAWYRVAAVFAGLILLLAGAYPFIFQTDRITVTTAYGEVRRLTLPDHSTVTLNGNSSLEYDGNWRDGEPREVWLKGEAYFSVTHTESDQLFRVNGEKQFQVEVLGTEFNVSTRQSKPRVVLNSGRVRLKLSEQPSDTVNLKPGEALEKNAQGQFIKRNVNPNAYSSWKSQKLVFEDTSLDEIVLLLQDTYGLSVQVSDTALLGQKLTGSVPNENVDLLLHGLAQLFDLKITREKEKVHLYGIPETKH
jgi:transmembrane sensor